MKRLKLLLTIAALTTTFSASAIATSYATGTQKLQCKYNDQQYSQTDTWERICDLGLTKQVSVNGAAYVSAETSASAVSAKVGDSVSYKITVTNLSSTGYQPSGSVTLNDLLPTGITPGSTSASTGVYSGGVWTFTLSPSNLPATLVLNGVAASTGTIENIALLATYTPKYCYDQDCKAITYADSNSENNQDQAYINVTSVVVPPAPTPPTPAPVKPVVPQAPNTGFGVSYKNPIADAAIFVAVAASFIVLALVKSRSVVTKSAK